VETDRLGEAQVALESAPNLTGPWTPVPTIATAGPMLRWEDSFTNPPSTRFYRRRTQKL
jgi:hypothetical protein